MPTTTCAASPVCCARFAELRGLPGMSDASELDRRLVRRSFERAARSYDEAAVLQREVAARMLERLDYLKCAPARILDAGSGTGDAAARLRERYRAARVLELDIAIDMLRRSDEKQSWWSRGLARFAGSRRAAVCGDLERLPFTDGAFDMVWSNLALQWVGSPERAFAEFARVLAPGGVLFFSTFGPDTLKELREAYAAADRYTHVNRFIDMHDLGDALVHARLADPVMDKEIETATYTDLRSLMRDLKAIGAHNVNPGRSPGLSGKAAYSRAAQAYERHRRDGRLPATFEVVYGHAWKPEGARAAGGDRAIVRVDDIGGRRGAR